MGNHMAGVAHLSRIQVWSVKAQKLRFANLLGVAEKLVTVLQRFVPGTVELSACGFAFNDQQGTACVVLDQHVCSPTASTPAQLPLWLQFNVLWLVAFFQ